MPRSYVRRAGERTPQKFGPQQVGRTIQVPVPHWVDPFFWVQGSAPEKMVMAEFVRRGIYFEHTPQSNPIEWGMLKEMASSDPTDWEADFLLPQYRIWLEVQGFYFHTLPGVPEKEALRFALIEAAGWRPMYWWDYDIEARLPELMDAVPEFYRPKKQDQKGMRTNQNGYNFYEGGIGIDHLAGLRAANRNRTGTPQYSSKWKNSYSRNAK